MYALASLWRSSGVPWSPPLLRGRRVAISTARGRMYTLASLWRPSGVPWSPLLLRCRSGTISTARGSDVRPGVPLASLWRSLVSAAFAFAWQAYAGVGQPPLPGGRMYALASSGLPLAFLGLGQSPVPGRRMYLPGWLRLASLGLRCFCVAGVSSRTLTHSLNHSLTPSLAPSLPPSLTVTSLDSHTPHSHHSLTFSFTHLCMHIHTYTHTQTHPPSPLHHSYTSSSLLAFLCAV